LITSGISELGQGSRTVFSQIASEVLGIDADLIEVNNYDTSVILNSGPTVASRGSTVGGRAVQTACENFISFLKEELGLYYNVPLEEIQFKEGYFYLGDERKIFLPDFCKQLSEHKEVRSYGRFNMPSIDWDEHTGLGIPYVAYHYGAHVSYVSVDITTGQVSVDKYYAIHDIGKVINPSALKGQINGGIATGIGYALMEDLEIHEGIIENKNFDGYIIATSQMYLKSIVKPMNVMSL
jgi:CO/xanthine dehydrogenase Mo-binding subunit